MDKQALCSQLANVRAPMQPELRLFADSLNYQERFIDWNPVAMKHKCLFSTYSNQTGQDIWITAYPEPCMKFIFEYDQNTAKCFVKGISTDMYKALIQNGKTYFSVKPLSVSGIKVDARLVLNSCAQFSDILCDSSLPQKIALADSFEEQIRIFTNWSKENLFDFNHSANLAEYCSSLITISKGRIQPEIFEKVTHYSNSYCRKQFKQLYGLSPKQLCRIIRFDTAIYKMMHDQCDSLAKLAFECGYVDQSHLINECKKLTDLTAKQILQKMQLHSA